MKESIRSYKPTTHIIGIKHNTNTTHDDEEEDNIIMSEYQDDDHSYLEDFNNVARMDTIDNLSHLIGDDRVLDVLEDSPP